MEMHSVGAFWLKWKDVKSGGDFFFFFRFLQKLFEVWPEYLDLLILLNTIALKYLKFVVLQVITNTGLCLCL